MAINNIILTGRLVGDPELKELKKDKKITSYVRFTIAVPRDYKNEDTGKYVTDFIDCVIFGYSAIYLANYGYKGREIGVVGQLQQRRYENKEGQTRYAISVKCTDVTLYGPSKKSEKSKTKAKKDKTGSVVVSMKSKEKSGV